MVGFTGRFVEEKGIDTLLEAFIRSTRRWNLLFVGGGPLAVRIESLRLRYPVAVQLVRDVHHDDMPAYLRAMDLLCAPSRTTAHWQEQFGRMLIEAMACGVPVVASDSGEIPHVVGDAGVLIPEDDLVQWTETIDRLLADPDAAQRAGGSRARAGAGGVFVAGRCAASSGFLHRGAGAMTRLRVALLADYLEEGWPSMDLVAEMLLDRLNREHAATIEVTLIRPSLRRRLSRVSDSSWRLASIASPAACGTIRALPRASRSLRSLSCRRSQLRAAGARAAGRSHARDAATISIRSAACSNRSASVGVLRSGR